MKRSSAVLGIRMPLPKFEALRQRAAAEGKTLSTLGLELIEKALGL